RAQSHTRGQIKPGVLPWVAREAGLNHDAEHPPSRHYFNRAGDDLVVSQQQIQARFRFVPTDRTPEPALGRIEPAHGAVLDNDRGRPPIGPKELQPRLPPAAVPDARFAEILSAGAGGTGSPDDLQPRIDRPPLGSFPALQQRYRSRNRESPSLPCLLSA